MKPTMQQIFSDLVREYAINTQGETVHHFSDKGTVHSYVDYYDQQFSARRDHARLLEIGLMTGASMLLWSRYFDRYELVGIDLRQGWNQPCAWHSKLESDPNIELRFGIDSTKPAPEFAKPFDYIIDDGAHDPDSQFKTFVNYWPCLAAGGTYFIEDVVSEAAAQDLIQRIFPLVQGSAHISRYIGHTRQRADDQIIAITRT